MQVLWRGVPVSLPYRRAGAAAAAPTRATTQAGPADTRRTVHHGMTRPWLPYEIEMIAKELGRVGCDMTRAYAFGEPATMLTTTTYPGHDISLFSSVTRNLLRPVPTTVRIPLPQPVPNDKDWELGHGEDVDL